MREPASIDQEPEATPEAPSHTIDELSALTGIPSRTIRFYQAKGVLPKPERRGRSAYYTKEHVERIALIGELQDRGLQLSAIRDLLLQRRQVQLSVSDWLGLSDRLEAPWSEERPEIVESEDLRKRLAGQPPGTLARLEAEGLVERLDAAGGATFRIASPGLLDVTLGLLAAGIDLDTTLEAGRVVRSHMTDAVDEVLGLLAGRAGRGFGRSEDREQIGAAIEAIRPVAGEAVKLLFVAELERALRSGEALRAASGKRPRRRSRRKPR